MNWNRLSTRCRGACGVAMLLAWVSLPVAVARGSSSDVDLRGGYYTDLGGVFFGGGVLTRVERGSRWNFNPNMELAFANRLKEFSLNGDFHYDLPVSGPTAYWFGAGPALLFSSPEGGGSDSQLGVNLLAGIGGSRGQVRPFAQLKGIVADNGELALAGGVRF